MISVSNKELEQSKPLGKTVVCWMCGKRHRVRYGEQNGVETDLIAYFKCKGEPYLCGVAGKEVRPTKRRSDGKEDRI